MPGEIEKLDNTELDRYDPLETRELYWQHVVAQMLSTLSVVSLAPRDDPSAPRDTAEPHELLDGRFAVITQQGMRIPIAEVHPLFACSVHGTAEDRSLSSEVQCTIFRIRTPNGETYTLPLQEIRGIHALSSEMLQELEDEAERRQRRGTSDPSSPFGFAAYTSLARRRKDPYYPAPPGFDPSSPVG